MKFYLLLIIALFLPTINFAQITNCAEKEIEFNKSVVSKDFTKAYDLWLKIKTDCPNFSEKNYILASQVLNYKIQTASKENKLNATQELIKLYDLYDKNFPKNANANYEKRALALIANDAGATQEIYNYLEKAFILQQENFTNPEGLNLYFKYYFNTYKSGKVTISLDQIVDKYNEFLVNLEKKSISNPEYKTEYSLVKESASALISGILSCDNLAPYVQKNFESKKENSNWLSNLTDLMSENCPKNAVYETILLQLYKIKPEAKTANKLSEYYLNSNDEISLKYLNDAVELESNSTEKSILAFKLATILVNSNTEKTYEAIKIAINNDPTNARYLLFLSNLFINSIPTCSSTQLEKMAIYKLASNTVLKAGEVDSSYKKMATKLSNDYLGKISAENSIKNKSVHLGCWINTTVIF